MRVKVYLPPSPLTPSGTGRESFALAMDNETKVVTATFRDEDSNRLQIVSDVRTLRTFVHAFEALVSEV